MAKKRKAPKPEAKVPLDPNATVFEAGDRVEIIRPNFIWNGYRGTVESVDGGMCMCVCVNPLGFGGDYFRVNVPAIELKLIL